ncbi:MAG TPA: hypothetical protein VJ508_01185, partial [Saprospiraceae bacterium]|nr:hypothetical protein [Saprospiraceae bacterium]
IIEFRTEAGLISADATVAAGSTVTIGIHAEKAEAQDVLKKFNISLSKNGGTAITVYDEDVTGADQDAFDFDFTPTLATLAGDNYKFTFTVTNRDGLTNNVSLTLTTN